MTNDHILSEAERAETLKELVENHDDHVIWMIARSHNAYHDLNAIAHVVFKKHGINYNSKDFKLKNGPGKAAWKEFEKLLDDKTNSYEMKGLPYACFRLAQFFFLLGDMFRIVEDASKNNVK